MTIILWIIGISVLSTVLGIVKGYYDSYMMVRYSEAFYHEASSSLPNQMISKFLEIAIDEFDSMREEGLVEFSIPVHPLVSLNETFLAEFSKYVSQRDYEMDLQSDLVNSNAMFTFSKILHTNESN